MDAIDTSGGEHGGKVAEGTGKARLRSVPDPEVLARPKRRTFTAEYKRQILE